MKSMYDVDLKGKFVILRVDINSPVNKETKEISINPRIEEHAKTIKELSEKGAKVIVLAHQGRKGEYDFLTLEQHAGRLGDLIGRRIIYVDVHHGEKVKKAIQSMNDGDVVLLENVRMHPDEIDNPFESKLVKELSELGDYYILDALSVAHRAQASIVGFHDKIPSLAGRVLINELENLSKIKNADEVLLILGGSKVKDTLKLLKEFYKQGKLKKALIGGAAIILFMKAKGLDIGSSETYYKSSGMEKYLEEGREILSLLGDNLLLPVDVGVSYEGGRIDQKVGDRIKGEILDIGPKTVDRYKKEIRDADFIFMNGPLGVYELDLFSYGTKEILLEVSKSKAFSLLGGGHTITAIEKLGLSKDSFGYISLSGKAMIEYILGKELPGPKYLEKSQRLFFEKQSA